jgi:hypothetical protein
MVTEKAKKPARHLLEQTKKLCPNEGTELPVVPPVLVVYLILDIRPTLVVVTEPSRSGLLHLDRCFF